MSYIFRRPSNAGASKSLILPDREEEPLAFWALAGSLSVKYCLLMSSFEFFRFFWNLLESFGIFFEYFKIFWNLFESFWIIWNHLESFGFFWILLDSFGFFWILLESFGIFWNLLKSWDSSLSCLVYLKLQTLNYFIWN